MKSELDKQVNLFQMPFQVRQALTLLETADFQGFAVGGCVRDTLMGNEPKDWDLCTDARPEEIINVFDDFKVIPTGIKHGTVTVVINHMRLEITTFRIDGEYRDNRHPEEVKFTRNIEDDLSRRDFTVNAIAYNQRKGFVDPFNGQEDIKNKIIRCVGDAKKRFEEDGLRIMRALRFGANLGFIIEEETASQIIEKRNLLNNVSMERINVEFCKLIMGNYAYQILEKYRQVIAVIIPEIEETFDFNQHNPYHCYDVYRHTIHSVVAAPKDLEIRLTMFFHDMGKPGSFSQEENGRGHFYGHAELSEELAQIVMNRLKFDNKTKDDVLILVKRHDREIVLKEPAIKRILNKIGPHLFYKLLCVKEADTLAQVEEIKEKRLENLAQIRKLAEKIQSDEQCFSMKDLAVNGRDLLAEGVSEGPELGRKLNALLELVIDGKLENNRDILIKASEKL